MQNSEMIKQFLELYLVQIPVDLQELKKAVQQGNHNDIANKAHHIKPTMEYIGAIPLRVKFQQLESAGKDQIDLAEIRADFLIIEQEIYVLLDEITAYRSCF